MIRKSFFDRNKALAGWLAVAAAAAMLGGCGNGGAAGSGGDPAESGGSGGAGADETEQTNKSLTLSLAEDIEGDYEDAFDEFRRLYPDVDLQVETYSPMEETRQITKQQAQVMAGEGPDILMFKCYGSDDLYKMMKAGAFAPMDAYMEADETWNGGADYVQGVIEAGKFGGSQYVMPLTFNGMCMIASQEGLDAAGVSAEDCKDTLSIMQQVASIYDKGYQKRVLGDYVQFTTFPEMLTGQFLDYEKENVSVDAETLRQACELYSRMYDEETEDVGGSSGNFGIGYDIARQDAYVFIGMNMDRSLSVAGGIAAEATPVCIPIRSGDGKTLASMMQYAGIRANSPNKQNAYNMIRILMGEEAQEDIMGIYCPVNKAVIDKAVDGILERNRTIQDAETPVGELSGEFVTAYKDSLKDVGHCYIPTTTCVNKFYEYMNPYFAGEADYDSCMKEFEDYIKIYLSE